MSQLSPILNSKPPRRRPLPAVCLLGIALAGAACAGNEKEAVPNSAATPVAVAKVVRENLSREVAVDAEFKPYQEIDLHAKVSGYLETIKVDIGDRVAAGQLLATLEIPELQDDLARSKAVEQRSVEDVARAQAAYDDTHLALTRLTAIDKSRPNLIAAQELDTAKSRDAANAAALSGAKAQVEVAKAETRRFQTMVNYSRISAPFAGVITKRYADPGALIQAGISSSTQTLPLVRISQINRLRLVFPVSVSYVSQIREGGPVEVRGDALPGPVSGTISRFTRKVDAATRKMEVEVDVANPDFKIIPGIYATVMLKVGEREKTLAVPAEALSRGKAGATAFVVNRENRIEERSVTLGAESPGRIEVLSGLSENDLVMIGSRTQVRPGQLVQPKLIETGGTP
ncbi:MAG TPA: efflux RND transporter periplasmic adaptor subunit [Verrucomicrobiae bacterium]|nr:efflux RND transporter periplasmic adaptor subunit [Verrucomicrobiae bacterium]